MKSKLLVLFFLLGKVSVFAQTGIGTSSPQSKLHIKSNGTILRLEGSDHAYMEFFPQGSSNRFGYFGYPGAGSTQLNLYNQSASGGISLGTNNTSRLFVASDGRIGMGYDLPATSLHIQNSNRHVGSPASTTVPSIYVFNANNANNDAHSMVSIRTGGASGGNPFLSWDVSGVSGYSMGINNANGQLVLNNTWDFTAGTVVNNLAIFNRTGQSRVIFPNSYGGYTTDWPAGWGGGLNAFDMSLSGIYYSTLVQRSDIRMKNSIEVLSDDLVKKYLQLRPVNYYWNKSLGYDPKLQYGLIAQEVEQLIPEMVNTATDAQQTKSINYQALHAISLKVIQEQQKQIEDLRQAMKLISERLLQLENRNQ